jgi:hypothetical protein
MRILALPAWVMLLLLTGCSGPSFYWYHPDRSLEEAKADFTDCLDQAHRKADDLFRDPSFDHLPPANPGFRNEPLDQKPSSAEAGEAREGRRRQYEASVVADCMREKGYLKIGAKHVPPGVHTKKFDEGAVAGR